jgi:hypothetical protein
MDKNKWNTDFWRTIWKFNEIKLIFEKNLKITYINKREKLKFIESEIKEYYN